MALVENLVVALGLRASGFSSGINKAKKELTGFQMHVQSIKTAIAGFLGGALGASAVYMGITQAVQSFRNAMESLGDLQDASTKLGISSSALRKFQFAATQSGVEIEAMNLALQKMLVNISNDAFDPQANDAFSRLGLSAKKLREMSPEKQFTTIASALAKVSNAADRAALAAAIFGKSGPALIPMLNDLEGLVAEAERLKLAFSDLDVAKVEAAGDEWAKVKEQINASWQGIAIGLAPAIGFFSRKIVNAILHVREFGSAFGDMSRFVVQSIGYMIDAFTVLTTTLKLQRNVLAAFVSLLSGLFPGQWDMAMGQVEMYMKNFEKALEDYQKAISGGFHDDMLKDFDKMMEEWKGLLSKPRPGEEMDFGGNEKIFPGAVQKGTAEAAEAAARASGANRATDFMKVSADRLADLNSKVSETNSKLATLTNLMNADAGIV